MALMKKSQYDKDADGIIDQAKDADTVDGKHATDFEQVANKGVANGYAPLDANSHVPVANLPDAVKTSNLQDVTPLRSFETAYQNTTGKHLMVIATLRGITVDDHATGQISSDNSTYTIFSEVTIPTATTVILTFIVPPNYYYKIVRAQTDADLIYWQEITI